MKYRIGQARCCTKVQKRLRRTCRGPVVPPPSNMQPGGIAEPDARSWLPFSVAPQSFARDPKRGLARPSCPLRGRTSDLRFRAHRSHLDFDLVHPTKSKNSLIPARDSPAHCPQREFHATLSPSPLEGTRLPSQSARRPLWGARPWTRGWQERCAPSRPSSWP